MKKLLYSILIITFVLGQMNQFIKIDSLNITQKNFSIIFESEEIGYTTTTGLPVMNNDRILVPLRETFEFMGVDVTYDSVKKIAYAKKSGINIELPINQNYMTKNGLRYATYGTTKNINGRIYISVRSVAEALHLDIKWDGYTNKVFLNTKNYRSVFYDLRQVGKVTVPKNQFNSGSCWAFAAMGAVESSLSPKSNYDFSEDNLSLGHGFNIAQSDGGDHLMAIAYFSRWAGPVLEKDDPFGDNQTSLLKSSVHVQEAQFIKDKNFEDIKKALVRYGAVQTSLYFSEADAAESFKTKQYYNGNKQSYYCNSSETVNHDILVIGWDDNYSSDRFTIKPPGNGAFICKNSYGTNFGDKGYFYVSYFDKNIGQNNVVYSRIDRNNNYKKIYQQDKLGWTTNLGYYSDTAYMAAIYTTGNQDEVLSATSFYAIGENTKYTIYFIPKITTERDFSRKIKIKEGTFIRAGYYTVELEDGLNLENNAAFAIVVKLTTPNAKYPIAAEGVLDESWAKTVDINDGTSYISSDGKKWESAEKTKDANVCLKVFTN